MARCIELNCISRYLQVSVAVGSVKWWVPSRGSEGRTERVEGVRPQCEGQWQYTTLENCILYLVQNVPVLKFEIDMSQYVCLQG